MAKNKGLLGLWKKLYLELTVAVVIVLIVIIILAYQQQTKISAASAEIKSEKEATSLEKNTSTILNDVNDALKNIDSLLPDV